MWFYSSRFKNLLNKNSETGSSDPSAQESTVEWNRGGGFTSRGTSLSGPQRVKKFTLKELEQATKHLSKSNLIGEGSFDLV
uniref:Uncharacterized protein n=1 Tax=Nelumbo nucifera TaxID=4432 RepID=A0A822XW42_NELNU|nr:TPA_asm: hypothetical protein HUJ06_026011 [Nelumbo nucifera]